MPYMMQFSCGCLIDKQDVKKVRGKKTKDDGDNRPIKYRCPTHPEADFIQAFFRCEKCGKEETKGIGGADIKRHFATQRRLCRECAVVAKREFALKWYHERKAKANELRKRRIDIDTNNVDYRLRDKVITNHDCKFYLSKCLPDAAFDPKKPKYVKCNGCKRYAPVEQNMIDHVKCSYDMICDNIYIFGDM